MDTVSSTKADVKCGKYGYYITFHANDGLNYTMSAKNFLIGLKKVNAKARLIFKDKNELTKRQLIFSLFCHLAILVINDDKVYLKYFTSKWL